MPSSIKKLLGISTIVLVVLYVYFSYRINNSNDKLQSNSNTTVLADVDEENKYKEFFSQFVSSELLTINMDSLSNANIKKFIEDKVSSIKGGDKKSSITIITPDDRSVSETLDDINNIDDFNLTKVTSKISRFVNTVEIAKRPTTPVRTPTVPTKPTVPIIPPNLDLCNNIAGNQTAIPTGYYSQGGACFSIPTVVDFCNNIPGEQKTIPSGYYSQSGACLSIPIGVDLCNNIAGNQKSIPSGYYSENGACFSIPAVVDLCNNIAGNQATIPTGYYSENGACLSIPVTVVDLCNNIAGDQATIPTGYYAENGACFVTPPIDTGGLSYPTVVAGIIDDPEAKRIVGVIKNNCGVDLALSFDIKKDTSMSNPSYKIRGSQITYNGDTNNNAALYALARASEDLIEAHMLWPSDDGIVCRKAPTTEQIKNVLTFYSKDWERDVYVMEFGATLGPAERTWFHWHHMSTKQPTPLYNASPFVGLAQKYPQMAGVPEGQIDSHTKIDLAHPDLPKVMYDKWEADGRPKLVSLFEIDGGNYHPYIDDFPMPEGLNPYEQETFKYTIQTGGSVIRKAGQKKIIEGKSYELSQEFVNNLKTWLPFYGTNSLVLTPQYLKGYKNIEQHFKEQKVTNVNFMIYGYAKYFYMPSDQQVDLSNFDLYYTSPGSGSWNRSSMESDMANWKRWERTGAKMIWRPNLWFINELDPYFNFALHNEFVDRMKPDGYMITGYQPGSVPGILAVNFYTMFRTLQGRSPSQALDDYINGFDPANQSLVRQYIAVAENVVSNKQQFTDSVLNEMMSILSQGNDDLTMRYLKKGVEITLKKNAYARGDMTKDQLIAWYNTQLQQFPGLGPVGRFTKSINENVTVEE